jgi:hypothetical protein
MSAFSFSGGLKMFVGKHGIPDIKILATALTLSCMAMPALAGQSTIDLHGNGDVNIAGKIVTAISGIAQKPISCFAHQIDEFSSAQNIKNSTLFLIHLDGKANITETGTGFIVHNSATDTDSMNKIVMASHVATLSDDFDILAKKIEFMKAHHQIKAQVSAGDKWFAIASDGTILGTMKPVVTSLETINDIDGTEMPNDVSVMSFKPISTSMEARYRATEGLSLGTQSDTLIHGQFGDAVTPGVSSGQSGSPFIGKDGLVYGILSGFWKTQNITVTINAPNILEQFQDGQPTPLKHLNGKSATLPNTPTEFQKTDEGFVTPISAPDVLAELGPAGKEVKVSSEVPKMDGSIVGFPQGTCVISTGKVGPGVTIVFKVQDPVWVQPTMK